MVISGLIGAFIAGVYLDKTKRFEETAKLCLGMSAVSNILLVILQLYNDDGSVVHYTLIFSFALAGFFGLPLLPVCMDMAVEVVYPIPEATSTGLLFIAGQLVGIALIVIYPSMATDVDKNSYVYQYVQTCDPVDHGSIFSNATTTLSPSAQILQIVDYKNPLYAQTALYVVVAIFFIIFFKCPYLRLKMEQEHKAEQILNSAKHED
jgi:MFS transporter, FLVCR family, MFS-domain-containing protein 7